MPLPAQAQLLSQQVLARNLWSGANFRRVQLLPDLCHHGVARLMFVEMVR